VQAVRGGESRASEVQRGGEEGRHPQEAQRRGGHDPGQTQVCSVVQCSVVQCSVVFYCSVVQLAVYR
jgi:hypothetical protein